MSIPNTVIVINKEPYCIWDTALNAQNLEYLNSIDPRYFESVCQLAMNQTREESQKLHLATLLRLTYYHALETFFSYIGALIQGPDCVCAWIQKASTADIKYVVEKIDSLDSTLQKKLDIPTISWKTIAELVLQGSHEDPEQVSMNAINFARCWSKLAQEFLRPSSRDEYNSMKHGLRIRSGGFSLLIGPEQEFGIAPPSDQMKTLTHSDYGSSYFTLEQCPIQGKKNRSYQIKRHSLNWSFESTVGKLMLLSSSIFNVVSFLTVLNGMSFEKVQFVRPSDPSHFDVPWEPSTSECHFAFGYNFGSDKVFPVNRQQLLDFISSYEPNQGDSGTAS